MPVNSPKTAAIVLAAGMGKRMKSDLPKVLHELNGKPLVGWVADTLTGLDINRVVVVVGYKKEMVVDFLKDYDFKFVEQAEQLGTGHAVMMAEKELEDFQGEVIVLAGDVPMIRKETIQRLFDEHRNRGAVATVLTSEPPDPTGYGRVIRNSRGLVEKIVEHKDASEEELKAGEINTGTFVFNKKDLFEGLKKIDNKNVQGEYYLTDLMEIFLKEGKITAAYMTDDYREALGINSSEQLKEVARTYNL